MQKMYAVNASETLEVDVDHFAALYGMAIQGRLSPDEEDEVLDVAAMCMASDDLDSETREFFQSAFLILNKKNKRFINVRKMNQMARRGEIGAGQESF